MHRPEQPLPAGAPAACEKFRKQPDALERAAELDAQYGRNPDLEKMPMYCAAITVKNWYDVTDMRSTGGNDVDYAMDAPPRDMTIVGQLRAKGAIISGITIASEVSFNKDGDKPKTAFVGGNADPQHLGRHLLQCLRHRAHARRQQRRRRCIGGRESRDVLDLRDDRRLVPHTRERQRGRELRHHQGHDVRSRAARRPISSITVLACCAARSAMRRASSTR